MTPLDKKIIEFVGIILMLLPWGILIFDIVTTTYKTRKTFLKFSSQNFFEWFATFYSYYLFAAVYLFSVLLLSLLTGIILALMLTTLFAVYLIHRYVVLNAYEGHVFEQRIKAKLQAFFDHN